MLKLLEMASETSSKIGSSTNVNKQMQNLTKFDDLRHDDGAGVCLGRRDEGDKWLQRLMR